MRRKEREVKGIDGIEQIIRRCKTCHLAMVDNGAPYVVPLNFGYEVRDDSLTLYFHSAKEGRKIDILHRNPQVCFCISEEGEPVYTAQTPCNSGYYYASVIGGGDVEFVEDAQEKCDALSLLMRHQAGMEIQFTPEQAGAVCVFRLRPTEISGKQKEKPA